MLVKYKNTKNYFYIVKLYWYVKNHIVYIVLFEKLVKTTV
jgi:hypothetical protein